MLKLRDFDPRRQPLNIRRVLLGIPALAVIWCLFANLGSSFFELIFHDLPVHLFIGLVMDGLLLVFSVLLLKCRNVSSSEQIAMLFEAAGYSGEMTEQLRGLAEINERAKVLRTFFLVMSEQYEAAEEQAADIMTQALPPREAAMLMTARLRLYLMTMRFERAEHLLANAQGKLDAVYAGRPDFSAYYNPYEDDAFEYYLLTAAYCDLTQQPEQAERYRRQAKERAESRRQSENMILPAVLELNRRYAAGEQDSANILEKELIMLAENLSVSQGRKHELRRHIGQAKIFGHLRACAKSALKNERQLPQGSTLTLPPELNNM